MMGMSREKRMRMRTGRQLSGGERGPRFRG